MGLSDWMGWGIGKCKIEHHISRITSLRIHDSFWVGIGIWLYGRFYSVGVLGNVLLDLALVCNTAIHGSRRGRDWELGNGRMYE